MTPLTAGLAVVLGCGAALVAGLLLRSLLRRARSLRRQILAITFASLGTGALVAVVLARFMVLDGPGLRMVVGVLGLTAAFASILVVVASAPLGQDVRRLEATVRAVEAGDRGTRAGIRRADELGHVANALDDAIARLGELEAQRADDDRRRRAMFTSISHDLRTPLAALRAALEAIEDGVAADPARYLRSAHRDVEALTALVDDLFLLARIESGSLEVRHAHVDLAELADEAIEALAPVASGRNVDLRLESSDRAMVLGNGAALSRVIRNLLDNAINHSPPGSTISIGIERGPTGDRTTVRVLDQGGGFPAGFRPVAFERFSRADGSRSRATGGAGLGLAIAHGLIEAHGGEIWIDDVAGGSVAFALPAA